MLNFFLTISGYFCPALSKAVKTMKKGERVLLTVKPECEFLFPSRNIQFVPASTFANLSLASL
jgi:hypothetical protein